MLNFCVYYRLKDGTKILRAMFTALYEAEKYVEEWHGKERTRWIIESNEPGMRFTTEYLD